MVTKDGEYKYIGIDDAFPIMFYHRSNGSTITNDKISFGGGITDTLGNNNIYANSDLIERTDLSLMVFAQLKKIKMTITELKDVIYAIIPGNVDKVSCSNIGIKSAFINLSGANFNSNEIYLKEYKTTKKLNPNFLLIEIKYNIESRFKKSCIKTPHCSASERENNLLLETGEDILLESGEKIILES